MPNYLFIQWLAAINGLIFVFAFGAIVGSFLNVVVYRLPKGLNLVTPPSACPHCETRLTWRENVPIVGWILLRGRCRFCRSRISPEYPIVELLVATLFALIYAMWFMEPSIPGINPEYWQPDWARDGLFRMWPQALLVCLLLAALTAITLIDGRTFTIPLSIPWLVTAAALVVHPAHALFIQSVYPHHLRVTTHAWTIPTTSGPLLGAALGGAAGLVLSVSLLWKGIIRRSFADYEQWENEHASAAAARTDATGERFPDPPTGASPGAALRTTVLRALFLTGPAVALMFLGFSVGLSFDKPLQGMGIGTMVGLLIGLALRRLVRAPDDLGTNDPIWVQYPHARREMVRELVFLLPCLTLGSLGWFAVDSGAIGGCLVTPPLWLSVLGGSLLGYLVGGGLVWGIRIPASLALGKEAMGLGDVHLMAAVGAVLGWVDPTLAFFVAPFFGLAWTVGTVAFGRFMKVHGSALPYGPHLAAATVVVIFLKPLFEAGLSLLSGRTIDLP